MNISVIIPVYNREKYIRDAIESVLTQKLPKKTSLEVIVVDDGSSDSTAEVVKEFGDRIIYKRIDHSGSPAATRNTGLGVARGDIIAFQDSDDLWSPNKIMNQLPSFDDSQTTLSYGNASIMDADGKLSGKTVIDMKECKSGYIFRGLLLTNFISTLTVMARKSALLSAGGFNESDSLTGVEDYELWLRMAAMGNIEFVPKILAQYRRHNANVSLNVKHQANEHILKVYKTLLRSNSLSKQNTRYVHLQIANTYVANLKSARGFSMLTTSLKSILHRILAKV